MTSCRTQEVANAVGHFTTADCAPRWRVSVAVAEEFLEHFAALGLVVRTGLDNWRVTERGYRLACGLDVR